MKKLLGFTLPELMVTLAIASVLLLLAVPSFNALRQYQHEAYVTQALTQAITYARLQAVLRHEVITLRAKENNWQEGFCVEREKNQQTLRDFPQMPLPVKLVTLQKNPFLKITPEATTEGYNGHFEYGGVWLIFNRGGRIRVEKKQA